MAYISGMPHTWSYEDTIDRLVFLKLEVFFYQERSPNKRMKKGIRMERESTWEGEASLALREAVGCLFIVDIPWTMRQEMER